VLEQPVSQTRKETSLEPENGSHWKNIFRISTWGIATFHSKINFANRRARGSREGGTICLSSAMALNSGPQINGKRNTGHSPRTGKEKEESSLALGKKKGKVKEVICSRGRRASSGYRNGV